MAPPCPIVLLTLFPLKVLSVTVSANAHWIAPPPSTAVLLVNVQWLIVRPVELATAELLIAPPAQCGSPEPNTAWLLLNVQLFSVIGPALSMAPPAPSAC